MRQVSIVAMMLVVLFCRKDRHIVHHASANLQSLLARDADGRATRRVVRKPIRGRALCLASLSRAEAISTVAAVPFGAADLLRERDGVGRLNDGDRGGRRTERCWPFETGLLVGL